jgi:hypothetical protein
MSISARTYGIEIECILPIGMSRDGIANVISSSGIDCIAEGYNHVTRRHWKVVHDGSLGDSVRGAEIVSPKLSGDYGFSEITTVMTALQRAGVTVNSKCGFHVHVGAERDDLHFHQTLAKFYAAYEGVIDSLMPLSRRANNNSFCRSITHASREAVDATHSMAQLTALLGRGAGASRYVKLNMTRRHPTVEFRQHSGTLEPIKAIVWTKTCLRMVEKAASGVAFNQAAPVRQITPKVRRGSKRAICVEMLLRPEGATREQLLAATGWPTISVQDVVSRTGMELLTSRMGRRITYRLNQAAAQATSNTADSAMAISVDGLCDMIGSAADEREYLNARASVFGMIRQAA